MWSGISILMTFAPQSASWRTQVGPERTRVRSSTVKRESARDAGLNGMASALDRKGRRPCRPGRERSTGLVLTAPGLASKRCRERPPSRQEHGKETPVKPSLKTFAALAVAVAGLAVAAAGAQEKFPARPIEVVTHAGVGGGTDITAR